MAQNTSRAVMSQRSEAADSRDDFPLITLSTLLTPVMWMWRKLQLQTLKLDEGEIQ